MQDCDHQWLILVEGTTIKGQEFFLYKCNKCGLFDIGGLQNEAKLNERMLQS